MKKNIKFIGAAAAALLAVAPVVASPIAAQATVVPGGSVTPAQKPDTQTGKVLTFSSDLSTVDASTPVSDLTSTDYIESILDVSSNQSSDDPAIVGTQNAMVATKNSNGGFTQVNKLTAGKTYYIVTEVTVNGLAKNSGNNDAVTYSFNKTASAEKPYTTTQGTMTNISVAIKFNAVDTSTKGNPYFTGNSKVYSDGQTIPANVSSSTLTSVSDIQQAIANMNLSSYTAMNDKFVSPITASNAETANDAEDSTGTLSGLSTSEIISQLEDQGITVNQTTDSNGQVTGGTFKAPTKGLTITLTQTNNVNGNTASVDIYFKSAKNSIANYPVIGSTELTTDSDLTDSTYANAYQQGSKSWNQAPVINVPKNTNNWAQYVIDQFKAIQNSSNDNELILTTQNLTSADMDVKKTGVYDATLKATNTMGLTTTLDFQIAVTGKSDNSIDALASRTVYGDPNEVIKLVSIVDDKVSNLKGDVVNQGATITVYPNDTKTVDGVEYTRVYEPGVSRTKSNWIPTKNITKPEEEVGVEKYIMHNAYFYNKEGKRTTLNGKSKAYSYHYMTLVDKKVKIGDSEYYKVPGKDVYIKAGNVDGTKRELGHNAYIYTSKGKRKAGSRTIKKGETVTTYGAAYTIKQNGVKKSMYRIAPGEYVKVSNFR